MNNDTSQSKNKYKRISKFSDNPKTSENKGNNLIKVV